MFFLFKISLYLIQLLTKIYLIQYILYLINYYLIHIDIIFLHVKINNI